MKKAILASVVSFVLGGLVFTAVASTVEGAKDKVVGPDYWNVFGDPANGKYNSKSIIEKYNKALDTKDEKATRMYQEILIDQNFIIIGQNEYIAKALKMASKSPQS